MLKLPVVIGVYDVNSLPLYLKYSLLLQVWFLIAVIFIEKYLIGSNVALIFKFSE